MIRHTITKTANSLMKFMEMTEDDIVHRFSSIPQSRKIPCKNCSHDAVFVPGTRRDRVLLVAHVDTVWQEAVRPMLDGTRIVSSKPEVGIGADDRFGVAALWMLRNSGHSLLIVPDEEIGCVGSSEVVRSKYWATVLSNHSFIIQFDRRGSTDFVTYSCSNKDFDRWMLDRLPGYAKTTGSFSDVCELMPALGIAGCNLSIGFRNEHTSRESGDVADFIRTVFNVENLLSMTCKPFEYIKGNIWEDEDDYDCSIFRTPYRGLESNLSLDEEEKSQDYYCPDCAVIFESSGSWMADGEDEYCPECSNVLEPFDSLSEDEVQIITQKFLDEE